MKTDPLKLAAARAEWYRRVTAEFRKRCDGVSDLTALHMLIVSEAPPIPEYNVPAKFPEGWSD